MNSSGTWWMWFGFVAFVSSVVLIDLFWLGRKNKNQLFSVREAFVWIMIWMSCAILFNGLLWLYFYNTHSLIYANQKALEFFTGYLIEQSLSTDNMFAFIMVFNYFAVPKIYQRRVLLYGVLSAIILRLIVILGGTWLVSQFHWILYIFGVFLIFTGIKMLFPEKPKELEFNPILVWLKKHIRVTHTFHKEKFFIKKNHLWYATPLFLVLILIELSDLVFALDSIPAIFAVTDDAFIIFTSNIFAILGLRALYFLLAQMAERFHLLRYGIALMLTFIGGKMLLAHWIDIPILLALSVLIAILGTTVILSMLLQKKDMR